MNAYTEMKRPPIPREWYQPEVGMLLLYLLHSMGMLFGFGYLSYLLVVSDISILAKAPLLVLTLFLASNGFHLLGFFAHDGVHLSLAKNKYTSALIGTFFGSAALFPALGYGITHWTHHRFTNQESDPDTAIYSKHRTFWRRFFLARYVANRGYFINTFNLMLNRPIDKCHPMPFTPNALRWLAALNIACVVMWAGAYVYIATVNLTYAIVAFVIPYLIAIPITGFRIYVEHAGTGAGIFRDTRTYTSPLYTALLFGNNFHLEHHLYPRVPCYKLPKVHAFLRDRGYFDRWRSYIASGILEPLRYTTGSYQYPEALIPDLPEDPFKIDEAALDSSDGHAGSHTNGPSAQAG